MAKKRNHSREIKNKQLEKILSADLSDLMTNVIWQDSDGTYEVFARYKMIQSGKTYSVLKDFTEIGTFNSSRTALGWCIADKFAKCRLAREILTLDNQLQRLKDDISIRSQAASRSSSVQFQESVMTKLETKIIRKKQIEIEINKCINTARQCQNQGFNNETNRTGRKTPNR